MTTPPTSLADVAQAIRTLNVVSTILGSLPSEPGMNGAVLLIDDKEAARCRREIEEAAALVERYAAQAAQVEPAAWMCPRDPDAASAFSWGSRRCKNCGLDLVPLYTTPPAAAQAEPQFTPAMIEAVYAAWHGAGVDIAGGNWKRFVGMLPAAPAQPAKQNAAYAGWGVCPKCGTDRLKAGCPFGACPMAGVPAQTGAEG